MLESGGYDEITALQAELRGAMDAHREAVASNDKLIRERDCLLLQNGEQREAFAKVAEGMKLAGGFLAGQTPGPLFDAGWNGACEEIAKRIRGANLAVKQKCTCAEKKLHGGESAVCPFCKMEREASVTEKRSGPMLNVVVCGVCGAEKECRKCGLT